MESKLDSRSALCEAAGSVKRFLSHMRNCPQTAPSWAHIHASEVEIGSDKDAAGIAAVHHALCHVDAALTTFMLMPSSPTALIAHPLLQRRRLPEGTPYLEGASQCRFWVGEENGRHANVCQTRGCLKSPLQLDSAAVRASLLSISRTIAA